MKFRMHRGSLADSLATAQECNTIDDLRRILLLQYPIIPGYKVGAPITIEYYAYDERCDQNLYLVSVGGNSVGYLYVEVEDWVKELAGRGQTE